MKNQKTVMVTGATGTLGRAICAQYQGKGWRVIAVSRSKTPPPEGICCDQWVTSAQKTQKDAEKLLQYEADLFILNAGAIEDRVGDAGLPLQEVVDAVNTVNYTFPSSFVLAAASQSFSKNVEVVAIGSIADASPSCFGPVYHSSKSALRVFLSGVAPIAENLNKSLRVRMYRPGVIDGPLAWAPTLRLNSSGYKVRAKRCENAPKAERVAKRVIAFIESGKGYRVGSDKEPLSFQFLKFFYAACPDLYVRLQRLAWKKGSRFGKELELPESRHS